MKYILTGTSGSGKTTILNQLQKNYNTVDESASKYIEHKQSIGIKEPWLEDHFINNLLESQIAKESILENDKIYFLDRSIIDIYILSLFLEKTITMSLQQKVDYAVNNNTYSNKIFFIENLGFIENNQVRQISYNDSLEFEKLHHKIYKSFGFKIIKIPKGAIKDRVNNIISLI